jgi:hypothetical protein
MFDEMSTRENLHFNQKFGCIEGFEDLGSHGSSRYVAIHALVFMLRGLHKNWKQPVVIFPLPSNTANILQRLVCIKISNYTWDEDTDHDYHHKDYWY